MATILCVDADVDVRRTVKDTLRRAGHTPIPANHVPEALQILERGDIDLVVADYRLPGITGLELLTMMREEGHDVPLVMLTAYASIEHAVTAVKAGAVDYLTKPLRPAQLEAAVEHALERARLRREHDALRRHVEHARQDREILGDSPAIRRVLQTAATAARSRATILLQGESGTGKELFARAIHDQSDRRDGPFIKLNCAALPEGLIESALFGHEKGAFTGALRRVEGAFERAHGGTLLLDEISEMRLDLQAKLLRVLQEREFERVGGTVPVRVDVRIVATTNRDLAAEAAAGRFRQDLYFRLATIPLSLPPLRERREDIPTLAYGFALRTAQELGQPFEGIAPDALALLQAHDWPGNVRELQHVVERAVILCPEPVLPRYAFDATRFGLTESGAVLARPRLTPPAGMLGADDPSAIVLRSLNVEEAEQALIARALEVTNHNRTRAAELLGMSVRTLRNKLNGPARSAA